MTLSITVSGLHGGPVLLCGPITPEQLTVLRGQHHVKLLPAKAIIFLLIILSDIRFGEQNLKMILFVCSFFFV
jgi:hypothetical protein